VWDLEGVKRSGHYAFGSIAEQLGEGVLIALHLWGGFRVPSSAAQLEMQFARDSRELVSPIPVKLALPPFRP